MLILIAVVVMQVGSNRQGTHRFQCRYRAPVNLCVARIEAQPQPRQTSLLEEIAQVCRSSHLAGRIFQRKSDAALPREQSKILKRAESHVPTPGIVGIS